MAARHWRVGTLEEFYPRSPLLLGRNVGAGLKVQIRLRDPSCHDRFLCAGDLVGTLLHEYVFCLSACGDRLSWLPVCLIARVRFF